MAKVLDSSAVLAFLYDEPGAEKVRPDLLDGIISAVNAAEVLAVLVRKGAPLEEAVLALQKTKLQVQEFSVAGAVETARSLTARFGATANPLADARGSDRSPDREGGVAPNSTTSHGHSTSLLSPQFRSRGLSLAGVYCESSGTKN